MITALPVEAQGSIPRQRLPDGQKVEGYYLEPDGRIRVAYDDDGDGTVDRYESIPVDSLAEARRQRMRERLPPELEEAFDAAEPAAERG